MARKEYKKRLDQSAKAISEDPDRIWEQPEGVHFFSDEHDIEIILSSSWTSDPKHPVYRAFSDAKLDKRNVYHWFYLLEHFATVHYQNNATKRTSLRTSNNLAAFMKAVENEKRSDPTAFQHEILRRVQVSRPDLALPASPGSLKALLSKARKTTTR